MSAHLLSIGTALPARHMPQLDAARHAEARCCRTERERRLLATAYRRSGVDGRHIVLTNGRSEQFFPGLEQSLDQSLDAALDPLLETAPTTGERMAAYAEHAGALAAEACRVALGRGDIAAADVSHIVTVSCTGFRAPGVDLELVDRLGLSPSVARTAVGFMGCHGALNGLRVARAFVEADPAAVVLLCCVELCSLHFAYGWDPQRMVANALFADGAAAVVVTGGSAPSPADAWTLIDQTSTVIPDTADAMTWTIGDRGFEMTLSPQVPTLIEDGLADILATWLATHDLTLASVDPWIVHPGGPRVLDAVESALALGSDALRPSRDVLRTHGNVSSVTLLLILERLTARRTGRPAVMLAFGPGLTVEAAMLMAGV